MEFGFQKFVNYFLASISAQKIGSEKVKNKDIIGF